MTNIAVVNGPIRNEIGMNAGIGAMGPHNHANVTIGRASAALAESARRLGPGETYMGTLGKALPTAPAFPRTRSAARGNRFTSTGS